MENSRLNSLDLVQELSGLTGLKCEIGKSKRFIRVFPNQYGTIWQSSFDKIACFCCLHDFKWFTDFNTGVLIIHM